MLGWINKKIGSGAGGSGQGGGIGGEAGASAPNSTSSGNGGGAGSGAAESTHQDQQRQQPRSQRGASGRRGSTFLDAVGGAIGRTSRAKKEEKSEEAALAEQLDAQRAERISCVAFKLVREIQRILKEAREKQAVLAAAAAAAGSPAGAGAGVVMRTPAATPPPSSRGGGGGGGKSAGAAAAAAAAATESAAAKRNRWAGTDELLGLLDGGSPGGAGEVEDKVERYGSMAEVQAKMSDLVEQALVPESHGDLCGQLLEAASGEGHHPAFVKLCVDAGLPSNLVHCLRIMRVVEFESAMHESSSNRGGRSGSDGSDGAGGASVEDAALHQGGFSASPGEEPGSDKGGSAISPRGTGVGDRERKAGPAVPDRPQTKRATERIGRLLVTLCRDRSAGVGEQIKPHLPGLLSLAVSAYPPNGAHVQETARAVVEALMGGCLNSSMVWLLHYNKVR